MEDDLASGQGEWAGKVEREDNGFSFQLVGFAVSVGWPNGRDSSAVRYESKAQRWSTSLEVEASEPEQ